LALLLCLLSSPGACALADAAEQAADPAGLETMLAAADTPPAQRVDELLQAAEAAKSRRRDDALRLATSALDQSRAAGLARGQWRARLLLADLSMAARDLAAAKTHLDAADAMQAHPDVQPLRAQWLYLQGRWLRDSKRDAESAARFVQAAELAASVGDDATEAKALHSHAMMLLRSGEQERARAQLQRSLELNLSAGRERDADANRHYLGQIARDVGDYALALSLHEQVLAHSEQRGDQQGIANSANAIAILQAHKNEDELALPYFERAAAAYRLLGDPHGTSMALANLGYSLSRLGRAEQADAPLQEALSIALKAKDRDAEALALTLLAEAELGAGRLEQSEQLANRARRIGVELGDQAIEASALVALSKVRFAQARPAAARDLLTQALPNIRAAARSADLRDNLGALAAAQAASGDYASAYANQLEVATLSARLQDERMAQRLAELRAAHEAQTRELELSAQRTRIEALEQQARGSSAFAI
jgi:tetratricopeptide (TPR) repeat protein